MGSSSSSNDFGETVKQGLCFPFLKAASQSDGVDSAGYMACPIGIGAAVKTINNAAKGNTPEALQGATEFFLPNVDPVSTGVQALAKKGVQAAYDELTKKTVDDAEETEPSPESNQQAEVLENARNVTAGQEDIARRAAMRAALNSGASAGKAQAIAGANTPQGLAAQNYSALKNAYTSQRNAELEKKAQADALQREAKNLEEAKKRVVGSSILQGAGQGGASGISIFGNSIGGGN